MARIAGWTTWAVPTSSVALPARYSAQQETTSCLLCRRGLAFWRRSGLIRAAQVRHVTLLDHHDTAFELLEKWKSEDSLPHNCTRASASTCTRLPRESHPTPRSRLPADQGEVGRRDRLRLLLPGPDPHRQRNRPDQVSLPTINRRAATTTHMLIGEGVNKQDRAGLRLH